MKIQQITENAVMTGVSDVKRPIDAGVPTGQGGFRQPIDARVLTEQGGFQLPGLQEFEALQSSSQVDMGNIKSRDLGNMLSGELVRIGEAAAKAQNPDVDFGDLPSRALTEMGKEAIKSE